MDPMSDPEPQSSNPQTDSASSAGPLAAGEHGEVPATGADRPEPPAPGVPDLPPAAPGEPVAPPPLKPAPVKRPTAAQIAESFTQMDDAALDQAVAEAMAGVTQADVAAAKVEPPKADVLGTGSVVTGRIANIGSRDVLLDLGTKAFGVLPLAELPDDAKLSIGDSIEVQIVGEDQRAGLVVVSHRKARQSAILRNMKVGLVVEGRVTGMNKGGLEMTIEGLRGFIPASQVDLRFMKDISELIGQVVRAEVTKFEMDGDESNVVLSRRNCLLRDEQQRKERFFTELEVGQVRRGRVRSVTDFGAFVDLGGVDGLLHVRDMSWGRVDHPESVVKPGDELDVMVVRISRETKKISLSLKQTITNPWETAAQKYTPGTKLQGRVVRLANFGAFVELEPGVDGLLPISEMTWTRRLRHPSELVKEGDVLEVAVLSFDAENKRIALSLKALAQDPWMLAAEKYAAGSMHRGKVVRTTDFGAFVQLEEGVDGLLHISEISEQRIRAVTDKVKPGDEVEVRILGVDLENKKVSLSMKPPPTEPSPEQIAAAQAERAKHAAVERKRAAAKPRRGGITFGWDQGLGSLDPSQFGR
jgi:small subunit ribosomal protein S1